jgi:glyoxylase-like metal-dependent hydrolase (beta-lactamase superfamily II)
VERGGVVVTIVNIGTLSVNKYWKETQRVRTPSATCTLLETGAYRIIVDPSPGPQILEPMLFAARGITPAQVDAVFLTHFHGDHRFGLALFEKKPWYMAAGGLAEWEASAPGEREISGQFVAAEGQLPGEVELVAAPGHTLGTHALKVATRDGVVVIAGDAVMTRDFFDTGDGFHNSADFGMVAQTIRSIRAAADFVVPGHGNVFPVRP